MIRTAAILALALATAAPAAAKDSLGVFANWAAFRDANPARCYAIAKPERSSRTGPSASIATWPQEGVRGQLHLRLSRAIRERAEVTLRVGGRSFSLLARERDAWARDKAMDAAIVAAMRSASAMRVSARDVAGRRFSDRYDLSGAATAIDAAALGCAGRR